MSEGLKIYLEFGKEHEKQACVSLVALAAHEENFTLYLDDESVIEPLVDVARGLGVEVEVMPKDDVFRIPGLIIVTEYDLVLQDLSGEWKLISPDYLVEEEPAEQQAGDPPGGCIISFSRSIPWMGNRYHHPLEAIWWEYAYETPFFREFAEAFVYDTIGSDTVRKIMEELMAENIRSTGELSRAMETLKALENN
ncbi:MAG: hypothetical protein K5840_03190 [Eubacterium sp.]|nr:hypothetical protein [Eubacterium sp.]